MSSAQTAFSLEYQAGDQPVPGYTLVRELGRGAMGIVWLAQTSNGIERAVKIINLQQRGGKKEYRGLREMKRRGIQHRNLLGLIDYWLKDRAGAFIPDSDAFDNTDSFFAPKADADPVPWNPSATTPQSLGATDVSSAVPIRGARFPAAPTPRVVRRKATAMPDSVLADAMRDQALAQKAAQRETQTLSSPEETYRRPVQLIVAMELGQKTLDDHRKQMGRPRVPVIPLEELLRYSEQAALGLDYLHAEGLIHRDVKPQNIMLVGEIAKVCDYGLLITNDTDLRTTSNAFTPLYASPEAVAQQSVSGQSDQYSLAVTYVELRTGRTPYAIETPAAVYAAKETGRYKLSRIRKRAVRQVIRRALSPSPCDRFDSCGQFVGELAKAENSRAAAGLTLLIAVLVVAAIAVVGYVLSVAR